MSYLDSVCFDCVDQRNAKYVFHGDLQADIEMAVVNMHCKHVCKKFAFSPASRYGDFREFSLSVILETEQLILLIMCWHAQQ